MGAYDSDIQLSVGLEPKDVVRTAEDLNNDIKRIFNEVTGADISEPFKELQVSMDGAVIQAKNLLSSINQLQQSGQAYSEGVPTDEFINLAEQLSHVNNQMVLLTSKASSMLNALNPAPISIFRRILSGLASVAGGIAKVGVKSLHLEFKVLKIAATAAIKPMLTIVQTATKLAANGIRSGIKKLGDSIKNLGKRSGSTSDTFNKGFKMFIRYGLGVRSLFALINKLRRALIEGFGNLAQVNEPFNKSMSEMMTALNTLKNAFASAFAPIIEVVSPILTKFINLIAEAVTKVGMLIATLTGKSSYARALPVYQDYAASVDKTSKSAKDAAKNTKDQNKAAKELKRTLAGFDDVEILEDNKDTTSGTTGSTGTDVADTVASAFENVSIDSAFGDLAKKLKDAWNKADFTEIGKLIGERLKSALESIDWEKIREVLEKIAKSIATLLNGFLETPGLFTTIGNTIAEAINSAFTFVQTFVESFHWDSLGTAIKDLIIGALDGIDWELIYSTLSGFGEGLGLALESALDDDHIWSSIFTTVSNGLNAIVYGINSFLNAVDWGSIAANIGNGLNDGINAFDWNALADTLSNLINAVFDIWYNFITTFDFAGFGAHIGETVSNTIKKISWTRGATSVALTINKLFTALTSFVAITDWESIGATLINAIVTFLKTLDWGLYGTFLSLCLVKLLNALTRIIKEIDWDAVPGHITTAIKDFLTNFDWAGIAKAVGGLIGAAFKALVKIGGTLFEDMKTFGRNIVSGGLRGIKDKILGIGKWIKTNLFKPFVDGFKAAFGIASPSKEMMPYGRYIIMGLLNGIIKALGAIAQWVRINIFNPIINAVKSIFGIGSDESSILKVGGQIINALLDGISKVIEGINSWVDTYVFTPIKNAFISVFGFNSEDSNLLAIGTSIINTIFKGITNILSDIGTFIYNSVFTPIKNAIIEKFGLSSGESELFTLGTSIIGKLKKGITDTMADIANWIETTIVKPILDGLRALVTGVASLFADTGGIMDEESYNRATELATGYADALENLAEQAQNTADDDAWDGIRHVLQELHDNGQLSDQAFSDLSTAFATAKQSGESLNDSLPLVARVLAYTNTSAEELNAVLGLLPESTAEAAGGLDDLQGSAENSDTSTDELQTSLGKFDKMSWSTPLKLALISRAIGALESKGKLSKEQVTNLQNALKKYKSKPTVDNMKAVKQAFKDTGISAQDFEAAVKTASENLAPDMKPGLRTGVNTVNEFATDMKSGGETLGKNVVEGTANAITDGASDVSSAGSTMITDTIDAMETAADSHSPSRKTEELGKNLIYGLKLGIEDVESELLNTVSTIINNILDEFDTNSFRDTGDNMITTFASGMNEGSSNAETTALNISSAIYSSLDVDGWSLGNNICTGIYNGLNDNWTWLTNTAWNLAVSIYNSACNALGISSPSKLFRDKVGKMIPAGLAEGIEDNSNTALSAIDDMTKDIENKAEDADPVISFTTNVENLISTMDDILTTFSDKITNGFSTLIDDLNNLSLPNIVSGRTVPYKANISTDSQDSANIVELLDKLNSDKVTRQDLISIFSDLFREYLDIKFYLGDEQIYRHAERGAIKINRRYNPVVE